MSELKPQGNYTLKQMQQSAKIASTADGIEISGNQFKVTELQACPDMLLFACEKIIKLEEDNEKRLEFMERKIEKCRLLLKDLDESEIVNAVGLERIFMT